MGSAGLSQASIGVMRLPKLPKGPQTPSSGTEEYWVDHYQIYNDRIIAIDVLVRDGELTSERRERTLTTAQVDGLFANQTPKKFGTWMSNIHGFATPI